MNHLCLGLSLVAFGIPLFSCRTVAATTAILHDGDSLLAAVAAASNGDVIEIQSNQLFGGTLTWSNKYLTIRAGASYSPSIGSIRNIRGSSQTGGEFRGLKITGTIFDVGNLSNTTKLDFYDNNIQGVVDLNGGGLSTQAQFVGNTIHGGIETGTTGNTTFVTDFRQNIIYGHTFLGGTGHQNIKSTFVQNEMQEVLLSGTGNLFVDARFDNNRIHGRFRADNAGNSHYDISLRQNEFDLPVLLGGGQSQLHPSLVEGNVFHDRFSAGTSTFEHNGVTILGNRFENSMALFIGDASTTNVFAANNIIEAVDTTTEGDGLLLDLYEVQTRSSTDIKFLNNTIVGYDFGVRLTGHDRETLSKSNFNLSLANTLLYNADDIDGLLSTDVTTSLISDGTFDGNGGNFSALPLLFPDKRMMPGSPGIDAGSNSAAAVLSVDFAGNPRFYDGNGDQLIIVDVGAFEYIPEPSAAVLLAVALGAYLSLRDGGG
jgi:hypothetical protein